MRKVFKFAFLFPLSLSLMSCSGNDTITFQTGNETFETMYNDEYFDMPNDEYHEEIALASHAMALAAFNWTEEDYTQNPNHLRDLWKKEGFEKMWFSDAYTTEPGTDTIGFGLASKERQILGGKYTIIAIAVRGGNYGAEWTSNLTIGESGNAQGFDEASDHVIGGLTNYLNNYKIEGHVKFWVSGYSRAAITSNMTAGKLLNKWRDNETLSSNIHYDKRDVYAYCFEPPMGVAAPLEEARGDLYKCIHNLVNYNDLVPLVAPYEWGFTRYGIDHYYPDRLTDIYFDETEREKLISQYHFTWGAQNFPEYTVDEWKFFDVGGEYAEANNLPRVSLHPSQGRFCRAMIHELAVNGFLSRGIYSSTLQQGIRELMATVFGKNEKIQGIDTSNIVNIIFEYAFIRNLLNELQNNQASDFTLDMELLILQIFGANEENIDDVKQLYEDNFFFFTFFANGFRYRQDISAQMLYRDNAMNIVVGHMPEISYSFLRSCDTRINGDKACKLNDGTYNILHIDNPQSFSLIEKNLKKTVFEYGDDGMQSDHLAAERFHDYSMDIYLPKNGEYEYVGVIDNMSLTSIDPFGNMTVIKESMPSEGNI